MIGTPELMGNMNKKLILSYLQKQGPQTRKAISKALGLSFPSVSANIDSLVEKNLVKTRQLDEGRKTASGRKPWVFEYNADWGYLASIDIGRRRVRMLLSNAAGTLIDTLTFTPEPGDRNLLDLIENRFLQMLQKTGISLSQVKHVSFSVPGMVSKKSGQLMLAPYVNEVLKTTRVDRLWEEKYGMKTSMQNNVNMAAIAEKWQGAGVGYRNILYLEIAIGVGSALIIDGNLMTGHHGAAGEIAYLLPGVAYQREQFSEAGPLEEILSALKVEQRMRGEGSPKAAAPEDLFADTPEAKWLPLLKDLKDHLGMTLVNMCAVVDPEIIIVGGGLGHALAERFPEYFEGVLKSHLPFPPLFVPAKIDGTASALGGLAYALRLLHDEPEYYD